VGGAGGPLVAHGLLRLKAKAKARDLDPKANAKAKDLGSSK